MHRYALCIALFWLGTRLFPCAAYPELFQSRHSKSCTDLPSKGLGSHGALAVPTDGSASFVVSRNGKVVTSLVADGRPYHVKLLFKDRPRHALVTATWAWLSYFDRPKTPERKCPNQLAYGREAGYSAAKEFQFQMALPKDASSVLLTAVSASSEVGALQLTSLTLQVKQPGPSPSAPSAKQAPSPQAAMPTPAPAPTPSPGPGRAPVLAPAATLAPAVTPASTPAPAAAPTAAAKGCEGRPGRTAKFVVAAGQRSTASVKASTTAADACGEGEAISNGGCAVACMEVVDYRRIQLTGFATDPGTRGSVSCSAIVVSSAADTTKGPCTITVAPFCC